MGHKSSTSGGYGGNLKNWKNNKPPLIDLWIHPKSKIAARWLHGVPVIIEWKDKQTGEKVQKTITDKWNCWEKESVLQEQYKRDEETGRRKSPPEICPVCLMVEWFREQVETGELDWTKPVFRFEGKDDELPNIVRAAGLYGGFNKKDLTDVEKKQLKDARVSLRDAWKTKVMAKLNYVFTVVPNDKPELVIATETFLLGDKVKEVIQKAIMSDGEDGNPFLHPYCIRWLFSDTQKEINKKYDAAKLSKVTMSEEVRKLMEKNPPSLKRTLARGNPVRLRAQLEEACLIKGVPWDAFFGRAEKAWNEKEGKEGTDDGTDFNPEELEEADAREVGSKKARSQDAAPCEECGELVPPGAAKCKHCGAKVDADDGDGDEIPF